ncbi:MAG: hypothetical protein AB1689_11085, partial [Thermodesulfobacteriota bacterium]
MAKFESNATRGSCGTSLGRVLLAALALSVAAGCGGGGGGGGPTDPGPGPGNPSCEGEQQSFTSTFEGIQQVIFERHGCTEQICHGSSAQGGLNLTADVAYDNIYNKRALGSSLNLVEPGDNDRSYLWLKLAASTNPGSVDIAGAPMPNGRPPLSPDELELVRLWIYGGAPREGTVPGTQELLGACLPEPEPIIIEPLEPPAREDGIQFVMADWDLPKKSEHELCFATYYDFTEQVPDEFKDPSGELFRFSGFELRQDPQSHHLLLYYSPLNFQPGGVDVTDPSFGTWTCSGGDNDGQQCDPKNPGSCPNGGICHSEIQPSFACVGYGPPSEQPAEIAGGAGQSQAFMPFHPGVFSQIPLKGVIYWNTHAFNTTEIDTVMHARLNYYFAKDQRFPTVRISDFSAIFRPNNPPFTKETFCNDHVFPVGSRVFHLFAHTHKHGEHFWVTAPDGSMIYESFDFSDPTQQRYDPPLAFDSPDPADRTVRYCGTFNNGVKDDGSPDVDLVTRLSLIPKGEHVLVGGTCKPVACVSGKVGAPCNGADDNATCDSAPGASDGLCDACPITGGESTQNEMFVLFGAQYIDPTVPGADPPEAPMDVAQTASHLAVAAGHDASGRSLATNPIFPHFQGCMSPTRGMGHAGH